MIWFWWGLATVFVFALIEAFALITRRIPTLSSLIWGATKRWPLLPFVAGLVISALAVHLWGYGWCPS